MTQYEHDQHCETLIDLLLVRSSSVADNLAYLFIDSEKKTTITYRELSDKAEAIGFALQKKISVGDRAILLYAPGIDFIAAFFGCLYAGVIAVPMYPPVNKTLANKLQRVIKDAQPRIILSTADIAQKLKKIKPIKRLSKSIIFGKAIKRILGRHLDFLNWDFENYPWLETNTIIKTINTQWRSPNIDANTIAFIQYTSGSTSFPKGVIITHNNLLSNLHLIIEAFQLLQYRSPYINNSWLPLYHDMGLIGNVLTPLLLSKTGVLTSPLRFLRNPFSWLNDFSQFKMPVASAPNFAFDYCVKKITVEQKKQLNLSHWSLALNGSEPIHTSTLENFYDAFKICGFKREALTPMYGLAEATVFVSGNPCTHGYQFIAVDAEEFKKNKIIISHQDNAKKIVACGTPYQPLVIVNPNTRHLCLNDEIGEIWLHGPCVGQGYWNNPEETEKVFHARLIEDSDQRNFLRTGDLGFLHEGQLYIAGRLKDLIIIHGENYYPQDFELTAGQAHENIRAGSVAAFAIEEHDEEHLVIAAEIKGSDTKEHSEIVKKIVAAIEKDHEVAVEVVALLAPKQLLKTTSGKIRRRAIKEGLLDHSLETLYYWRRDQAFQKNKYVTPETSIEIRLCETISALTNKKIGLEDDFFSLGGDSLLAAQLISKIQTEFSVELTPETFFNQPRVADLVKIIENKMDHHSAISGNKAFIKSEREQLIPLSNSQKRLWLINNLTPKLPLYNLAVVVTLKGEVDISALEKSCNLLVSRHEILRTTFVQEQGTIYQKIHPSNKIAVNIIDYSDEANTKIEDAINTDINRPFNLTEFPLVRFTLFKVKKREFIFLITLHHIIGDAWSLPIVFKELAAAYNSYAENTEPTLDNIRLQYADFSVWQSKNKQSVISKDLKYWLDKLKDVEESSVLLTDKPRPTTPTYRGSSVNFKISPELNLQLNNLSKELHVSFFMILISVFYVLLYRYTDQHDLIIGSPITNRNRREIENLIGFFVNTVALRVNCNAEQSFSDLLMQVRKTTLEAIDHQDIPFEQVVDVLKPNRHLNLQPIFQVMFVYQDLSKLQLDLTNIEAHAEVKSVMSKFDLTLEITAKSTFLEGRLEYSTDLFSEDTIKNIANHYLNLVKEVVTDPYQKINNLQILSVDEEKNLLNRSAQNKAITIHKKSLHHYFEHQAQLFPDNLALVTMTEEITYEKLNQRANQLAHHLISKNITPGDFISIMMDRSVELAIGLLAIAKCGGISIPLDPFYPESRLQFILQDSNPKYVLTQKKYEDYKLLKQYQIITYDAFTLSQLDTPDLNIDVNNESLAFIIYTSGSTGNPKGVLLSHQGISSRIDWLQQHFPLSVDDILLHQFSFSFDAGIIYFLWPLTTGATVVLPDNHSLNDLDELVNQIKQYQVTVLSSIPTVLKQLVPLIDNNNKIKYIISGGESFSKSLFEVIKTHTNATVLNLYGPTECSIFATAFYEQPSSFAESLPIGKPITDTELYLLDSHQHLVPAGVPGEVYLGGRGLAAGYLNQSELTAKSFIDHPFIKGQKLYKTGDMARYSADGNLEFLGRKDFQLKISGYRIEPEEIESNLNAFSNIKESAVAVTKEGGSQSLIGFLVVDSQEQFDITNLRSDLLSRIPSYMIPAQFQIVDSIPHLPNGKVDRKTLRLYELPSVEYQPPGNTLEKKLTKIWESLLNIHPISIRDNFFMIGGDSMLAFQLLSKINQEFGAKLSLESLFISQTISDQARYLSHQTSSIATHTNIIKLNNNHSGPNLFCIHPVGGRVLSYQLLAKLLEDNFTVYGIQSPGIQKDVVPFHSIEEMADYYITEIRTIQPKGPYSLFGWSLGGLVAFEMARKLNTIGESVSLLALADTQNPEITPKIDNISLTQYYKNLGHVLDDALYNINPQEHSLKIKILLSSLKHLGSVVNYIIPLISVFGFKLGSFNLHNFKRYNELFINDLSTLGPRQLPLDIWLDDLQVMKKNPAAVLDKEQLLQFYENFRASFYASENYQPSFYNGSTIFFTVDPRGYDYRWQSLATSVEKIILPGTHYNLMRNLSSLEAIKSRLIRGMTNGSK